MTCISRWIIDMHYSNLIIMHVLIREIEVANLFLGNQNA